MRLWTIAALAATAFGGVMLCGPAEAQTRRQAEPYFYPPSDRSVYSRPRSRITVQRRSYLDAGTEVLPGERKYQEYAAPYGYSAMESALGPLGLGWNRQPFNGPFDVPGRSGSGFQF